MKQVGVRWSEATVLRVALAAVAAVAAVGCDDSGGEDPFDGAAMTAATPPPSEDPGGDPMEPEPEDEDPADGESETDTGGPSAEGGLPEDESTTGDGDPQTGGAAGGTGDVDPSATGGGQETGQPGGEGEGEGGPDADVCAPSPADGDCNQCTKTACCDQLSACDADRVCGCIIDCSDEGGDPGACQEACGASPLFDELTGCVIGSCLLQCV